MPIVLPSFESGLGSGLPGVAMPGTGSSVPGGVDAIFEYNGLFLNDRNVLDKYRILEVDGLYDADVRDNRSPNPSANGETAFDAYYGGRTITLTGRVEAHTLQKLRDMQQALRQAFSDLEEHPLVVHTGNIAQKAQVWCRKSQPIAMKDTQQGSWSYRRDFMITLRASNPKILSLIRPLVSGGYDPLVNWVKNPRWETNNNFWSATVSVGGTATGSRQAEAHAGGSWVGQNSSTTVPSNGDVALYQAIPNIVPIAGKTSVGVLADAKVQAAAAAANNLETYIRVYDSTPSTIGYIAVTGGRVQSPVTGTWYTIGGVKKVSDILAILPTAESVGFHCRMNIGATSGTYNLRVDRAMLLVTEEELNDIPGYFDGSMVGVDWVGTVDNSESVIEITEGAVVVIPVNDGNYEADPVIRVNGAVNSPTITNLATDEKIVLNANIADGDYRDIDIAKRTIVDSTGASKFGDLDFVSDWITLAPGDNPLELSAVSYTALTPPSESVSWYNTWL